MKFQSQTSARAPLRSTFRRRVIAMARTGVRWVLLPIEVILGFVLVGIAAVLVSGMLHLWHEPFGGFFAAIAVVTITYFRAPARRLMAAIVAYLIGCAVAYGMLWESSFYPENYPSAYEPTNLPFWVTFSGGTLALIGVAVHALFSRRTTTNTWVERMRER